MPVSGLEPTKQGWPRSRSSVWKANYARYEEDKMYVKLNNNFQPTSYLDRPWDVKIKQDEMQTFVIISVDAKDEYNKTISVVDVGLLCPTLNFRVTINLSKQTQQVVDATIGCIYRIRVRGRVKRPVHVRVCQWPVSSTWRRPTLRMMHLAWVAALCVAVAFGQYNTGYGSVELGRVGTVYRKDNTDQRNRGQDHQNRDQTLHQGHLNRNAVWTGAANERDDSFRRNQQQFRDQAAARRQNYANNNKNFGNIVQQIRDEGLRNAYKIKDAAKYARKDQDQANGFNAANARKNAFDRGSNLEDNINYKFNKKFNKQSSESGGFEDENGRKFSKLDLIDEREKDEAVKKIDNAVSRRQNDQQQAIKESDWRAAANQAQAQGGQFGFGDRRLEAAGERSEDRAIDYNRKDNQFRENESGIDSAIRLAKDLAEQAAGYRNEAGANADSTRSVKDKKYYGGEEAGTGPQAGYAHAGGGPGARGPKARNEGSGGRINSGFAENADQKERGEELARATALSAADARNEYERLKDRVVYDEVRGLKDRAQGAFRQGLSDTANQGFSKNAAEAAKHSSESDKSFAGAASASDFAAKQKELQEALRDRDYFLKKQNDESETFTRRKQFFHNKNEGGNNDEQLKYNRNKKAREFGAAEEADLAKQNQFARSHKDAKIASNERNFEDSNARRAQLQHSQDDRVHSSDGFSEQQEEEAAKAGARANAQERKKAKENSDDSRSEEYQNKAALWDTAQVRQAQDQATDKHAKDVQANLELATNGGSGPFGAVSARKIIGGDVLNPAPINKRKKERVIPHLNIDIQPPRQQVKVEPPKQRIQIAPLPPVSPVKTYAPPKYNKKEVDYSTHLGAPSRSRNLDRGELYGAGNFQRINTGLFSRPSGAFSRINANILGGGRRQATNAFKKPGLTFSGFGRSQLGSLTRQPATGRFSGAFRH
ncbi:hypothetical protein PoB_003558700 [Plakobranchus ocellatus]|uniref:Uncharacterized protein n=1 Tax=Plakobranchus ocellatus TaxID=259542 RepID=A0AAV4AP70_9GAST|nr:hypothetical protein PoB_003558700 [Plakobranchus ocellatus]